MQAYIYEISKRFRQSKQQDSYISFVSKSSTTGIALGCAILILLLSVMNGFEYELRNSLLKVVPHAEIFAIDNKGMVASEAFVSRVESDPRVEQVFLLNKATGLLQAGKKMKAVSLIGVNENYLQSKFSDPTVFSSLKTQNNGIVLGRKILQQQGIEIGDQIQLLLPNNTQDLSFQAPKSAWLTVVGEVTVGGELDKQLGLVNRAFLAELLGLSERITHIEMMLKDPFEAYQFVREYGYSFDQAAYMSDWTRTNGHLYQDIQLIRTVVYIVLALVIAVASFNIVSALVMSVKERSKEIAILKTIGATNMSIAMIFILKGLYHGVKGAFVGTILGVFLALFLSDIISAIEFVLNIQLLSSDIYFTRSIPSKLVAVDVFYTVSLVLFIAVCSTLYPAVKAAGVQPAANLH